MFSSDPDAPDAAQREAARKAVLFPFAVISGGPGTGKTSTVVKILVLLFEQAASQGKPFPRVKMMAPTGKAANRLRDSVKDAIASLPCEEAIKAAIKEIDASTIHRALGTSIQHPTSFRHNLENPLPADVVVVDEASMVDLPLMAKLLDAVPPVGRLILLGDKDQLVSVEVGAVLGDICAGMVDASNRPPQLGWGGKVGNGSDGGEGNVGAGLLSCLTHLSHSFRFKATEGIGRLARAINDGKVEEALRCLEAGTQAEVGAYGRTPLLVELGDPRDLGKKLEPFVQRFYLPFLREHEAKLRLELLGRFRILCAHRRGPTGVESLNPLVEEILSRTGDIASRGAACCAPTWYDGRPVMVTRNDYQLDLFNGDVGVICGHGDAARAHFPGGDKPYLPAQLPPHETVFAMTAHKSQGSEFDHVLVVLPEKRSPVVTRELVYTAVTRARQTVTLIGSKAVIAEAIAAPVKRASGLRERLWGADGSSGQPMNLLPPPQMCNGRSGEGVGED